MTEFKLSHSGCHRVHWQGQFPLLGLRRLAGGRRVHYPSPAGLRPGPAAGQPGAAGPPDQA